MKFEELSEVKFLSGSIVVGDLAHQDVGAELLDLVADDLVNGGPGGEGVPGVGAGVGDGAWHQVNALGRGLQISPDNNEYQK